MRIALIDYGAGNLRSAEKALAVAARSLGQSLDIRVTSDPDDVMKAERIVLPGDGAFADCRENLLAIPGLDQALEESVRARGRPFLGICVGMQLLVDVGLEARLTPGLGWIGGTCEAIKPGDPTLKVPHMGWNTLSQHRSHPLLDGLKLGEDGHHAYFLHGYHVLPSAVQDIVASADYGGPITAIIARDNMVGTQFHPEKSQVLGLSLLANFLKWAP